MFGLTDKINSVNLPTWTHTTLGPSRRFTDGCAQAL